MSDIGKDLQDAFMDGYRYRDAELVRCNKCEHWEEIHETDNGLCYGFKYSCLVTPRDGFCFKGDSRDK